MDLATGAMGSLLGKLGELLKEEYKLQTGVKEDVQYLERELKNMQAALRKVGDVPRDQLDAQVKLWANEVRDLSYRMEDAVDKFLVRVKGSESTVKPDKIKQLIKKMGDLLTKGKPRHEIASEVKGIKVRVQEVAALRDRYKVDEVVANHSATTVDPRLLDLYKDWKDLVGIDEALSKLTNMLTQGDGDGSKKLKIFSIFGFGGLGKTTLAKAVYDKLQTQFDCTAFVPVGRNPSRKKLLSDILFDISSQNYPELDERQLINKLRTLLENKRYFIVIDDIWEIETWKLINCALVRNNCASRIITTTRILEVAEMTGDEVYKIKPLPLDLSEELFNRRLFGGKNKCPHSQSSMVKCFLYKCGGVPLAIITMASVLVGKPMEVEAWSKVYNSIGFGDEHNKDVENTRKILLFSYYDLPCHLRTCLLYLSQYREDQLIVKDSLILRWVAEGFILEEQGVGLFETGERYFNALVNKSLLQPVEIPHHGIIRWCRVHDIVLDIIRVLASEENFITILDRHGQPTHPVHDNVRRLAVGNKNRVVDTGMPQVRTFNSMCFDECHPSLSCFKFLRVLSLSSGNYSEMNITNHLKHLGKLVHLRYLSLAYMNIAELPKDIGDLKFLHTLDFYQVRLEELPQSLCQQSLKCLWLEKTNTRVPDWIGNLTSLEILCLDSIDVSSNFVNELGKLTELRKLHICGTLCLVGVSRIKSWAESLVKLQKIQVIDIGRVESTGYGDAAYCWECFVPPRQLRVLRLPHRQPGLIARISPSLVPNLSHLAVKVVNPDLEIFGRFPELVTLELTMPAFVHDAMGGPHAFSKLRVFSTGGTPRRFLEGDMPVLESLRFSLVIPRASKDGVVDDDFEFASLVNLPSLQKLRVDMLHAPGADIDKAKEAVRHAIHILPNPPILQVVTSERALGDSHSD